ncbi:nitroreductase family protein [uncultured Dysosmobacter sp.]|uniref:nitroreductase family protein n=1 Tax=uncultured Dysosmobacter sp. TaxID=2591384 RepID=UPI0026160AE0|nr:nitroreductase family protein [uncultured Dysosmobacter sp.]
MEVLEAIRRRHAVRQYTDRPIPAEVLAELREETAACSREGGLHIELAADEPEAFQGIMAHYGKFRGVRNYLALVGPKGPELDEKIGYYGERLVLKAAQLGLDSCWVALTFRRGKCRCTVAPGEKLVCVIALGYGTTHGVPHKSKPMEALCRVDGDMPAWFRAGMEAALLAPTAVNQQKFRLTLDGNSVRADAAGGPYSRVDLGIVKYHFEIGAGRDHFTWK